MATATANLTTVHDPVGRMKIEPAQAAGHSNFNGETDYFCSDSCHAKFGAHLAQYTADATSPGENVAVATRRAQASPTSKHKCAEEYARQKRQFILALVLTIPISFLAMAGHLIPALQNALNFPVVRGQRPNIAPPI